VGPRAGLDDVEKRKFLTQPRLELQPVASRYTDYAITAPNSDNVRMVNYCMIGSYGREEHRKYLYESLSCDFAFT
jgi:hypothetical protein